MELSSISLYNFRSYTKQKFEFSDTVTLITGANGVGKTNLLEAVYALMMGKSFRDADDGLTRFDEAWWRIKGVVDEIERELRYQPNKVPHKELYVGGVSKGRFTRKYQVPIVLFEPDDLLMVHGQPSMRRGYIDQLLTKIDTSYGTSLTRYERALRQRNNLLKKKLPLSTLRDAVFAWDISLAEYGSTIQAKRIRLVEQLHESLSKYYSQIAGKEQIVTVEYEAKTRGSSQMFSDALARSLETDMLRTTTSVGPHRDDIIFLLNTNHAKHTASRGEVRTIVLALKQFELELFKGVFGVTPIYLLDDVFSELDETRQKQICETSDAQKIITSTHYVKTGGFHIEL